MQPEFQSNVVDQSVGDEAVRRNDVGVRLLAAQHLRRDRDVMTIFEKIRARRRRYLQNSKRIREDDDRIDELARDAKGNARENERRREENDDCDRAADLQLQQSDFGEERERRNDEWFRGADDQT